MFIKCCKHWSKLRAPSTSSKFIHDCFCSRLRTRAENLKSNGLIDQPSYKTFRQKKKSNFHKLMVSYFSINFFFTSNSGCLERSSYGQTRTIREKITSSYTLKLYVRTCIIRCFKEKVDSNYNNHKFPVRNAIISRGWDLWISAKRWSIQKMMNEVVRWPLGASSAH